MEEEKMENSTIAAEYMKCGYNCAQSIVKAYGPVVGLDPEEATIRMAAALGAGIGREGTVCGALTGACLILGWKFGNRLPADTEAREKTYAAASRLLSGFRTEFKSIMCRDLTGVDMTNPSELARARADGVFQNQCPIFVAGAGKYLEQILAD
jgi:C_GCAxxG_C_C family probable redox protein